MDIELPDFLKLKLKALFQLFTDQESKQWEAFATLSPELQAEWDKLKILFEEQEKAFLKLLNIKKETDGQKALFWAKVERWLDVYDKSLKIEGYTIWIEKKEEAASNIKPLLLDERNSDLP